MCTIEENSLETEPGTQSGIHKGSDEDSVSMQPLTEQSESDTENKPCIHKDIDAIDDPIYSPEYAQDVYHHMRKKENIVQPTPVYYMAMQQQITAKLRAVLVDWMVEVQESFELYHETLYLAVKYVDRYLSAKNIKKDQLQLVGTTAMLIASKFEETSQPMVEDFLYVCDDAYTREQLLAAECEMLHILEYNVNIPIAYRFLRRFARAAEVDMEIHTLARYICELTLQEYDFIGHKASLLAASALYLALKMKGVGSWSSTLEYYTEYKESDLLPCVIQLNTLVAQKPKENMSTIRNKYAHSVFYESSKVPPLRMEEIQL
jgi:cyclin B